MLEIAYQLPFEDDGSVERELVCHELTKINKVVLCHPCNTQKYYITLVLAKLVNKKEMVQ
jgi:hypothetical protein